MSIPEHGFSQERNVTNGCQLPGQAPKPVYLNVPELLPQKQQPKGKRECVLVSTRIVLLHEDSPANWTQLPVGAF